jgi:hypothetical protein
MVGLAAMPHGYTTISMAFKKKSKPYLEKSILAVDFMMTRFF